MFVQPKAGHAQGSTTERYLHANRTSYPEMADPAETRLFGTKSPYLIGRTGKGPHLRALRVRTTWSEPRVYHSTPIRS